MTLPVIIAKNQTASPVELPGLGVTVPASGQTNLTESLFVYEILNSQDLHSALDVGSLILNVGGTDLTLEQSKVYLAPASPTVEMKHNLSATTDPSVSDDDDEGYSVGSRWVNTTTRREWVCMDDAGGAAFWKNVSLSSLANIVIVSATGDADFTTIKAAVDYVATQSPGNSNPWLIQIAPGNYTETNPMTIPPGVIVGAFAGERVSSVLVTASSATEDLFVLTGGSLIGLNLGGVTDAAKALIRVATPGQPSVLRNIAVNKCAVGLLVSSGAIALTENFSAAVAGPGVAITDTAMKVTGSGSKLVASNSAFSVASVTPVFYTGNPMETAMVVELGAHAEILTALFDIYPKNSTQAAIRVDSGSFVTVMGGDFENNNTAVQIAAGGSGTECSLLSCNFENNTLNFEILSSTGKIYVSGTVDGVFRNLVTGAELLGVLQRRGQEFAVLGNAVYEFPSTKKVNLAKFFHNRLTSGLTGGGGVTNGGGLTVDVASGTGWIQRNGTDDDAYDVTWSAAAGLALTASTTNYVVYDSATAALEVSVTPPSDIQVDLATVVTSGSGIRFIHNTSCLQDSPDKMLFEYLLTTRTFALKSGLAVTTGTTSTKFDVDAGSYYRSIRELSFGGVSDAIFSYFYGAGGATEIASQTVVDDAQWDNAGTLTALTAGYFKSDTVILTSDGRISVLYGTAEFSSQSLAEATTVPIVPTFLAPTGVRLARLIIKDGGGIVSIMDERPNPASGGGSGGGSGTSVHGLLSGLGADDHTQYLLVSGLRAMSGNLDMGANAITNVGLVDGVDIPAHAGRHNPGGLDAVSTAAPVGTAVQVGGTAAEGSAATLARSDHTHTVTAAVPVTITDSTNAVGSASTFVRSDHQHAHGDRAGGTLHAVATTSVAGFMSATDKVKLDSLGVSVTSSVITSTPASTTSSVFQDAFPGQNITLTDPGDYLILLDTNVSSTTAAGVPEIAIQVNASVVADSQRFIQGNGGGRVSGFTHTLRLGMLVGDVITGVFRKSSGTGTTSVNNRRFTVMRVNQ